MIRQGSRRRILQVKSVVLACNLFLDILVPFICGTGIRGLAAEGGIGQTESELKYVVDGISVDETLSSHVFPHIIDFTSDSLHNFPSSLRFEPPMLDFGEHPVGMPLMESVVVSAYSVVEKDVQLLSISGTTAYFHCSFFQDKVLAPGANTTFDVVFLARETGNVENTLYIHTSVGTFKYQVFGVGTPNPYRLRPFLGAKIPRNSSFSPLISMHNPYNSTLQVVEMYTSGGDLHLELPSGQNAAPKTLWEIRPYETKSIMRASFIGRVISNHTTFIRIKTNQTSCTTSSSSSSSSSSTSSQPPSTPSKKKYTWPSSLLLTSPDILVLPVEVEVTEKPGIFASVEMLHFGTLRSQDEPRTVGIYLVSSAAKHVQLTSMSAVPDNPAISFDFRPIKLPPRSTSYTHVGSVTFTASKATNNKQSTGRILIRTKHKDYKLTIPYSADVFHG